MKFRLLLALCLSALQALLAQNFKQTALNIDNAIRFVENKHQWEDTVRYRAELNNGYLFVYANALQYSFYDGKALFYRKHPELHPQEAQNGISAHSFVVDFLKANPHTRIEARRSNAESYFFYKGNNPKKWATDVKSYQELYYHNLYKNIDYRIFSKGENLKYEFIVKPQADARKIQMHIKFADAVEILPDGSLEIKTSVGSVYEKKPYSYQIIEGKKVEVPTEFALKKNIVSFYFPKGYHRDYPLIIDPELIFSTYSGGRSDNWGNTATFDNNGKLYSAGTTYGTDFPRFTGAIKIGSGGLNDQDLRSDIAVFRYNATGTILEQLIFIGGNSSEVAHSLVVDRDNRLLILGTTSSTNFPITMGSTFIGGSSVNLLGNEYANGSDIFVMKINPNGSLNRSRLIGGTGNDGIKPRDIATTFIHNYGDELRGDIYTDENKNVYIASTTRSNSISGISGSLQGSQDGLVVKMDENLNFLWGTYLGGSGLDFALSIKTNTTGEVYVGGGTTSNNFPATTGGMHATARGNDDGFIAKFSPTGTLLQATYLGTTAADMVFLIDLDAEQNVYAFGQTFGNYPVSAGVYNNPNSGQFIHKIDANLATSLWSTRIGAGDGNPDISPTAFMVVTENNCGNIYIAGWGGNTNRASGGNNDGSDVRNMPTTPDAFRRNSVNGSDFYLAVYRKDMQGIIYATFFGENSSDENGDHVDGGTSRFSKDGTIYHVVCASCRGTNGFPTTQGAWARSNGSSNCNNAAFKIAFDIAADFQAQDPKNGFAVIKRDSVVCVDRLFFKNLSVGAQSFLWQIFDENGNLIFSQNTQRDFFFDFTKGGIYTVRLTIFNNSSCKSPLVVEQKYDITIPGFIVTDSLSICQGSSVQLSASGAISYQWTPPTYLNNPNIPNPIATPLEDITYTLTLQNDSCTAQRKIVIKVDKLPELDYEVRLVKDCFSPYSVKFRLIVPDSLLLDVTDDRVTWTLSNGVVLQGIEPPLYTFPNQNDEQGQNYTVTLSYASRKCQKVVQKEFEVPSLRIPPNTITPNGDGINDTFVIEEKGAKLTIWNRWGKPIYKTDNYQNEWGTQKEIVAGLYYYQFEAPSGAICKGWVQVMK